MTGIHCGLPPLISSIPTEAVKPRAQPHFRARGDRLFIGNLNAIGRPPAGASFRVTQLQNLTERAIINRQNYSGDVFAVFDSVH
jgi:hypothetical protein